MSEQPEREPRMGPRCQWCAQPFQDGEDHHERMDCIRVLRRGRDAAARQLSLLEERRREWVHTEEGTDLLKRLGWTAPADWWTYRPDERRPIDEPMSPSELSAFAERLANARKVQPADVDTLLVGIHALQQKVDLQDQLGKVLAEHNERLLPIARAAWDCFHAADPSARAAAADRLAQALAQWRAK